MNWQLLAQADVLEAGDSAWKLLRQGGPMVWVLLLVSAFAVTAFLERVLNYRRVQINTTEFIAGIRTNLKNNYNIVELVAICDATPGPVATDDEDGHPQPRTVTGAACANCLMITSSLRLRGWKNV